MPQKPGCLQGIEPSGLQTDVDNSQNAGLPVLTQMMPLLGLMESRDHFCWKRHTQGLSTVRANAARNVDRNNAGPFAKLHRAECSDFFGQVSLDYTRQACAKQGIEDPRVAGIVN